MIIDVKRCKITKRRTRGGNAPLLLLADDVFCCAKYSISRICQESEVFYFLLVNRGGSGGRKNESKTPLTQASLLNIVTAQMVICRVSGSGPFLQTQIFQGFNLHEEG